MTKPKIIPQPTTELGELLGTEDRGQHPARARELLQLANAPVLTVVIQHDLRGGRTTVSVMESQGDLADSRRRRDDHDHQRLD